MRTSVKGITTKVPPHGQAGALTPKKNYNELTSIKIENPSIEDKNMVLHVDLQTSVSQANQVLSSLTHKSSKRDLEAPLHESQVFHNDTCDKPTSTTQLNTTSVMSNDITYTCQDARSHTKCNSATHSTHKNLKILGLNIY